MAGCPLRPTHVFILQEHPLSPGVLDDRDEAGDDHAAEEHDEDAADVGQTHLRARRRRRLRKKKKERVDKFASETADGTSGSEGTFGTDIKRASCAS